MKTYDFIKKNIGSDVYITGDGDLAMNGDLRKFIFKKIPLKLVRLTRGGMAILEHKGEQYSIRPRNIRLYSELKEI